MLQLFSFRIARVGCAILCFAILAALSCSSNTNAADPASGSPAAPQSVVVLEENAPPPRVQAPATANQPFDYYVLALSWSPQHCSTPAGRNDAVQCGGPRPYAFILHGLWPQYERGWPQDCEGPRRPDPAAASKMLDIMPSAKLIQHEWQKHGTCSGLDAAAYFAAARKAFSQFKAPDNYGRPDREIYVSPALYKSAWLEANPGLMASQFAIQCSGRYLREVRICLDKNLQPRPCGADVRDSCRVREIIVRPLK